MSKTQKRWKLALEAHAAEHRAMRERGISGITFVSNGRASGTIGAVYDPEPSGTRRPTMVVSPDQLPRRGVVSPDQLPRTRVVSPDQSVADWGPSGGRRLRSLRGLTDTVRSGGTLFVGAVLGAGLTYWLLTR